jgi:hypothetical protein
MHRTIRVGLVFLLLLSLFSSVSAQQTKPSKKEVSAATNRAVELTSEQVKGLREGKLIPLTAEQKAAAEGEGVVAVVGAGFAVLGAALSVAQLWQWHHAGHGHNTQIHIHYWRGVPYVHFHHP